MTTFLARLRASPYRRVPLEELRNHFFALYPDVQSSADRSMRLLEMLRTMEAAGEVKLPAAGSWEKIGTPPLPLWITVHRDSATKPDIDHSAVAWAPELGFWPELRPAQLLALRPINDFLLRRRGTFMTVPIKERSLEIYGDEKKLDALCSGDTLFSGRLHLRTIGCFRVPQPLPYRDADAAGQPLLVVENHNTYWSFAEWNLSHQRYSAVVYGGGENFRLTGRALQQVMAEVNAPRAEYFGDLDPKGVGIPIDFNASVDSGYPTVSAALPLYRWLLSNGTRREKPLSVTLSRDAVQAYLGEICHPIFEIWDAGQWIPQEALGTEQLATWTSDSVRYLF